jgi:hypothetical protein
MPEMSPWNRRALKIPPDSPGAWVRLAIWELWMGMIVSVILGFGVLLIVTAPDRVVAVVDLANCYGPPPVSLPCDRMVYRGGALYAMFSALCGALLVAVGGWLLWELWNATEPKPIADDFLRLLDHSFGRDWRKPRTWPWARVLWAYGFTLVGVATTAGVGMILWSFVASSLPARTPTIRIETSANVTLGQE